VFAGWTAFSATVQPLLVGGVLVGLAIACFRLARDDGRGTWCEKCVARNPEEATTCEHCGARLA
jgi:hypothetical protein